MKCPKCAERMEAIVFEGVTVDRCGGCGGIWFDPREREALIEAKGAEVLDSGDPITGQRLNAMARVPCPVCTGQMIRMVDDERPEITFELCAACGGSFLDAGELRELKRPSLRKLVTRILSF